MANKSAIEALGVERQSLGYAGKGDGPAKVVSINPSTLSLQAVNTPPSHGISSPSV